MGFFRKVYEIFSSDLPLGFELIFTQALIDLTPQTLVLVTGDGHKGKSRGDTSFINCAIKAVQLGWNVEVLSWKHSLSMEWMKVASKHSTKLKIISLDE